MCHSKFNIYQDSLKALLINKKAKSEFVGVKHQNFKVHIH